MARLRYVAVLSVLTFILLGISYTVVYKQNDVVNQVLENLKTKPQKVTLNDVVVYSVPARDIPFSAEISIEVRNNLSRLLNAKQHELAKLQCEVR